MLTTTPRR